LPDNQKIILLISQTHTNWKPSPLIVIDYLSSAGTVIELNQVVVNKALEDKVKLGKFGVILAKPPGTAAV